MSYGAIPTQKREREISLADQHDFIRREQSTQSQSQGPNGLTALKILAVLLGITLIVCVVAALAGSPAKDPALLRQAATNTNGNGSRRGGRFRSRNSQPIVTIDQGNLQGVILQSRAGRDYYGFYNVPYGKPPVGELRFMPPEPAEGWEGTRNATVKGSKCIQPSKLNASITEGNEDCLHTNIYTPKIPGTFRRKPKLPVIVYFFGGNFMHGTANDFNALYFMDEDVVIVIVESRVGAFGFLNTGDLVATGNQGLKDQNLALKWVQKNIEGFGGDPTRVVTFGTSSGAMCAHAHLLSPMSAGLFSGLMSFSGTVLAPGAFTQNPRTLAEKLGQGLGCPDLNDSKALVACLRNATPHEIVQNQPTFSPTVEAIPEDGNLSVVFMPDTPINLLKSGKVNKIPWITGVNSAEAIFQSYTLLLDPVQVKNINENWDEVIQKTMSLGDDPISVNISRTLHEFYFGNKSVGVDTRYNLTNMMSDRMFIHPAVTSAVLQAQQSPVYTYYLTKEANVSWAKDVTQYFDPPYGVSHADEVQYFFLRPGYPYIPLDSPWGNFSTMVVKFWVSFAETGAPISPTVEWKPITKDWEGISWFNLDDEPKYIEPITERMKLWNSFPIDVIYNQSQTVTNI